MTQRDWVVATGIVLGLLGLIVLAVKLPPARAPEPPSPPPSAAEQLPGIGREGFVWLGAAPTVVLFRSEADYERYASALAARDDSGAAEVILRGRLVEANARVLVLDGSVAHGTREVRVLDGKSLGARGVIVVGALHPRKR